MPQIAVLRSGAFKKSEETVKGTITEKNIPAADENIRLKIKDVVKEISETVNLEDAQVIVSGGRGRAAGKTLNL